MDNYYESSSKEILREIEQLEEKRKTTFRKNLPSYVWLIIKDLFALFVILGIFNFANNQFETVVFSLLIIVYISIEGFFSSYGHKTMQVNFALLNEFLQIKQLLKYKEDNMGKEKREKAIKAFNKLETHVQIHSIFLLIFFLIALWNLISAII